MNFKRLLPLFAAFVMGILVIVFIVFTLKKSPVSAHIPVPAQITVSPSQTPAFSPIADAELDEHLATSDAQVSVTTKEIIDEKYLGEFSHKNIASKEFSSKEIGLEEVLKKKYGDKTISKLIISDGQYAQGSVQKDSSQVKWWIAAKKADGIWNIVSDGYSYVLCEDISSYSFPSAIVPMCWSTQRNTLIQR